MGEGFTWETQDRQRDIAAAEAAWAVSQEMLRDPSIGLVVLDELNIALKHGYLDLAGAIKALQYSKANKVSFDDALDNLGLRNPAANVERETQV